MLQKIFFFLTPCQVIVFFIFVVFLMLQNKDKNNDNFIYDALTPKCSKKWLLVMFQKCFKNHYGIGKEQMFPLMQTGSGTYPQRTQKYDDLFLKLKWRRGKCF